jgi:hypothetical protein
MTNRSIFFWIFLKLSTTSSKVRDSSASSFYFPFVKLRLLLHLSTSCRVIVLVLLLVSKCKSSCVSSTSLYLNTIYFYLFGGDVSVALVGPDGVRRLPCAPGSKISNRRSHLEYQARDIHHDAMFLRNRHKPNSGCQPHSHLYQSELSASWNRLPLF